MSALQEIMSEVPGTVVPYDPDVHGRFLCDGAAFGGAHAPPLAVAWPASTSEVQALARWATRHGVPLVPRGAGTGLAGGANASPGSVVVSFEKMTRIVEIDPDAMLAVVQPGVLNVAVKNAAREVGLWYPPDPSSFEISTIGGNVATNAGGLCCVRYGVTGNYVLGLEVVLADGTALRTGARTRQDVAGFDLTRLLVGSEGTLAMVTEITLSLRRRPPPVATLVATFTSLEDSGRAAAAIVRVAEPSMLEIMDRASVRAVEKFRPMGLDTDAAAMLIAECDASAGADIAGIRAACEGTGGTVLAVSDNEAEGELMRAARRSAYPALERLGKVLIDDVTVPLPRLAEMMRRIEAIAANQSTLVATVAHAGAGNLHPLVVFDAADLAARARAVTTFEAIMDAAIALRGTISGEHGIGTLKLDGLRRQLSPASLALHARIKDAFDPDNILNPGKLVPRR